MTMQQLHAVLSVLLLASSSDGFHVPSPILAKHLVQHSVGSLLTSQTPPYLLSDGSPMTTAEGEASWVSMSMEGSYSNFWMAEGGALDIARNIAFGITAIVFLLAGITYLYASFIIPAAAQELETECKELNPQLWEEYQAKLGEGETLATRPDLMQEMGSKLQPLLEAKLAAMDQEGDSSSVPSALETTLNPMGSAPTKSETESLVIDIPSPDQWDDDVTPATKK